MIEYNMSLLEIAVQKSWNEISHFHSLVPVSFEPGWVDNVRESLLKQSPFFEVVCLLILSMNSVNDPKNGHF